MLDLDARVHLDEEELPVLIQELECPRAAVADRSGTLRRSAGPCAARSSSARPGAGDFLDDFLVTPLHRAVALAQMHGVAVTVGEHLELDMARMVEEFLHVHADRCRTPTAPRRA